MKKLYLFILSSFLMTTFAFAGGCAPNTTTGTCNNATSLTVGGACVSQTTCNGAAPNAAGSGSGECSWSSFVATSSNMVVNIPVTNSPDCFITSSVYSRTGACSGLTQISFSSGTPMDDAHYLNNLVIGQTYYVEVCEPQFGPCGGDEAVYCIDVKNYIPCNNCSVPCGVAQGFPAPPAAETVVASCTATDFSPLLQPGHTYTFCNTFSAVATSVSFNVIITSNCGSGNVSAFTWSLYNYPSCGAAIQTGDLSNLTFTSLTVGNDYNFCYTFTVPAGCTHTKHCPYYVGATVLPIKLLNFNANYEQESGNVVLDWATISEINNDFFTVEKSVDGVTFEVVSIVKGAGNSNELRTYDTLDRKPYIGTSYYRLKQTDFDGQFEYFNLVAVKVEKEISDVTIYPNPVSGNGTLSLNVLEKGITTVVIYDISGRQVYSQQHNTNKGANAISLETNLFSNGMYFIHISNGTANENLKFIKE
ncbi:MAG: T9SS type A sorting domain-containing protein [Vicingaceae bacterium]|nr:T9SS type A sorting domain-containing protein [Vicingaceae bacterium]